MKRITLLIWLIAASLAACHAQKITKLRVLSMNIDIKTFLPTSCESIENFSNLKTFEITDQTVIAELMEELTKLPAKEHGNIIRIKLIFYTEKSSFSACISQFTIEINDKVYAFTDRFKKKLKHIFDLYGVVNPGLDRLYEELKQ